MLPMMLPMMIEEVKDAAIASPRLQITSNWQPELTKLQVFGDMTLPIEH